MRRDAHPPPGGAVRSMRALAAAAALLAPGLAAGDVGWMRFGVALDGALSRFPQEPRVAAGGALSARLSIVEAVLALDWAVSAPRAEAGFGSSSLLGGGLAVDASPLVSLHAHAVVGTYSAQVRDFVFGGWRAVDGEARGGRAGIRLHPPARLPRDGHVGLWPVAGLWITVLRVDRVSDPLRAARWGGTLAVLTLSLGAELTGPARHVLPQR